MPVLWSRRGLGRARVTPPRPRKANGPHVIDHERQQRDGESVARAVCTCGWKGTWEKFFRSAHAQGTRHKDKTGG